MSELTIEVQMREERGKNAAHRLRAGGMIPAVVYGGGADQETVAIKLDSRTLQDLLKSRSAEQRIFLLKLADSDKSRHAMIRELQVDPVTREVIHADFQRVVMTEAIRISVPVELVGIPEGVKNEGAVLDFSTREVEVQCLPTSIPGHLEIDVSHLHAGQHVEAKDLPLPEGVELISEPDRVIASVHISRMALKAEAEEEEEEALLIEAEQAEPEVIGRGKAEEGEAEETGES